MPRPRHAQEQEDRDAGNEERLEREGGRERERKKEGPKELARLLVVRQRELRQGLCALRCHGHGSQVPCFDSHVRGLHNPPPHTQKSVGDGKTQGCVVCWRFQDAGRFELRARAGIALPVLITATQNTAFI
jgi:hypothetical protein